MEFRQLGASGFMVPVFSLGTGTFGGKGEFFKSWGENDAREATRLVDICLDAGINMFDSADIYSGGAAEEILGAAIKGRRDQVIISTKATFRHGEGPNDVGSSRFNLVRAVDKALTPPGNGLHRHLPIARLRRAHAGRGDAANPRRPGARGQASLHRRLELLRLALDEVAGRLGSPWLESPRRASGVLLADRPRLRVGADAAGHRAESQRHRLEPAGLGPT